MIVHIQRLSRALRSKEIVVVVVGVVVVGRVEPPLEASTV